MSAMLDQYDSPIHDSPLPMRDIVAAFGVQAMLSGCAQPDYNIDIDNVDGNDILYVLLRHHFPPFLTHYARITPTHFSAMWTATTS